MHIELFIDERVDRLTDLIDLCRVLMVVDLFWSRCPRTNILRAAKALVASEPIDMSVISIISAISAISAISVISAISII